MTTLANVTKLFSLVIILHLVVMSRAGADVAASYDDDNESRGGRTIQNFSDITSKLLQIRSLLKQLFFDWNSYSTAVDGESEIEDSPVGRTFGRIRLIRQMVLPITFFGGFLTAIIFGIAKTGIINMLLIKAVLALQMLLIVGKLAYGAKELLSHKKAAHEIVYYPQPVPPAPHYSSYGSPPLSSYGSPPSSSYGWNRRQNQEEVFKDYQPSPFEYGNAVQYSSPYNYVNNQQASQPINRSIIKRSPDNYNESTHLSSQKYPTNHRMSIATHATDVLPLGQLIESRFTSQTANTQHQIDQNHNHHQANYPNY